MRTAIAAAMITLLLPLIGCSNDGYWVDGGFNIVENLRVVSTSPAASTQSGYTEILLRCQNRYAGRGTVWFSGRGGGSDVGIMHSPVEGPVGSQNTTIELPAGSFDIAVAIEITSNLAHSALDVKVACDSLYANGVLVAWDSTEGRDLYRDDIPGETGFLFNETWVAVDLARPTP